MKNHENSIIKWFILRYQISDRSDKSINKLVAIIILKLELFSVL